MKVYSFLFLVLFFSLEYYFVDSLTFLEGRALYFFELSFILFSLPFFFQQLLFKKLKFKEWFIIGFTSVLTGVIIATSCRAFNILIPFDLKRPEGILMLLLLGPILEEFLYRFALWNHLKNFFKEEMLLMLVVSGLFSFGHFYPYLTAPNIYYPFIIFQTIYTFFLSIIIGMDWIRHRNFIRLIAIHIFFNLGFFLGIIANS